MNIVNISEPPPSFVIKRKRKMPKPLDFQPMRKRAKGEQGIGPDNAAFIRVVRAEPMKFGIGSVGLLVQFVSFSIFVLVAYFSYARENLIFQWFIALNIFLKFLVVGISLLLCTFPGFMFARGNEEVHRGAGSAQEFFQYSFALVLFVLSFFGALHFIGIL